MISSHLPAAEEMYRALLARDASYEGIFFVGVRTTGIFCRPTCPARKPKASNVEFFASTGDALSSGYRPCFRCRPLEREGHTPAWLRDLVDRIEQSPARRWSPKSWRRQWTRG